MTADAQKIPPLPVATVARDLGLSEHGGRYQCPACGHELDGGATKRGPVYLRGREHPKRYWTCVRCDAYGDALDLVGYTELGKPAREARGAEFAAVLQWLEDRSEAVLDAPTPTERPPERIPEAELLACLRRCRRAGGVPAVAAWLDGRGIEPERAPCGVLPRGFSAEWWPRPWSRCWPIVAPAFNGHGQLRGLHAVTPFRGRLIAEPREGYTAHLVRPCEDGGDHPWTGRCGRCEAHWPDGGSACPGCGRDKGRRSVCGACGALQGRKSTWPVRVDSAGLVFARPGPTRAWMRGDRPALPRVLLCEGLTDFLAACCHFPDDVAVLGLESGSAPALALLDWSGRPDVREAFDPDDAGDRYREAAARHLPDVVRLHRL